MSALDDGRSLNIRVEVMPEPRHDKPPVVALAAAIGRAPLISDIDTTPSPRGAMLPYPPAPSIAAECASRAQAILEMGGTLVLFVAPHAAAAAERWLTNLKPEGVA